MTDFHPLRWLLVFFLGFLWATMGSAASLAERGDFGHYALAAKGEADFLGGGRLGGELYDAGKLAQLESYLVATPARPGQAHTYPPASPGDTYRSIQRASTLPLTTTLKYDGDANLIDDGEFLYTWDGENRLKTVTPKTLSFYGEGRYRYRYDYLGRRVGREVDLWSGGWFARQRNAFVYRGWNLVLDYHRELPFTTLVLGAVRVDRYVWGMDMSGTLQGAGGVGGLLMTVSNPSNRQNNAPLPAIAYYYLYDGAGNVTDTVHENGYVMGQYRYDAFGNLIGQNPTTYITPQSTPDGFIDQPFLYSTKWLDETDAMSLYYGHHAKNRTLYYYGYRYYSTQQGRWLGRDPLGELGGKNLFAMVGNNPVNAFDVLGLAAYSIEDSLDSTTPAGKCQPEDEDKWDAILGVPYGNFLDPSIYGPVPPEESLDLGGGIEYDHKGVPLTAEQRSQRKRSQIMTGVQDNEMKSLEQTAEDMHETKFDYEVAKRQGQMDAWFRYGDLLKSVGHIPDPFLVRIVELIQMTGVGALIHGILSGYEGRDVVTGGSEPSLTQIGLALAVRGMVSKSFNRAANSGGTTSRAARREAMRQEGIPTSQQPVSQSKNASGREYQYETPKPGGGTQTKSVQQQTMDSSHPGQGHWEAGTVKTDPVTGEVRMNNYGRPKLQNDKSKVDYDD